MLANTFSAINTAAAGGNNAVAATYAGKNIMSDADGDKIRGRLDKKVEEFIKGDDDTNRPDGYKLNVLTKTCFDIIYTSTTTMNDAIDILLRNDYDGAGIGGKK